MSIALAPPMTLCAGQVTCLSTDAARGYGKSHEKVLRCIQHALTQMAPRHRRHLVQISMDVRQPDGSVRATPAYRMSHTGFMSVYWNSKHPATARFTCACFEEFDRLSDAMNSRAGLLVSTTATAQTATTALELRIAGRVSTYLLDQVQQHGYPRRDIFLTAVSQCSAAALPLQRVIDMATDALSYLPESVTAELFLSLAEGAPHD